MAGLHEDEPEHWAHKDIMTSITRIPAVGANTERYATTARDGTIRLWWVKVIAEFSLS